MTRVESLLLCTLGTHSMCVSITKSFQFCSLALEHYSLKKASFITQLRNFHSQFVNFLKFTKYCSLHSQFALQKSRVQLKYPLTFWCQVVGIILDQIFCQGVLNREMFQKPTTITSYSSNSILGTVTTMHSAQLQPDFLVPHPQMLYMLYHAVQLTNENICWLMI